MSMEGDIVFRTLVDTWQLYVGVTPEVNKALGVYHFGGTHEHVSPATKLRNIIK